MATFDPKGTIDLVLSEPVARIVINWPERQNSISLAMWETIPYLFAEISCNPRVATVIMQGAGDETFGAGEDIADLESCSGSKEWAQRYMGAVESADKAIMSCGLPVIAVIKGHCTGAGLEIAMACDLRIATNDSVFAASPARFGTNYSHNSTRRLVELVGAAKAKDMLFTGRQLDASEALRIGLAEYVESRDTIDDVVEKYVQKLVSNSQYSIQVAKLTIEEIRDGAKTESDRVRLFRSAGFLHSDFHEGITALREHREPNYKRHSDGQGPVIA